MIINNTAVIPLLVVQVYIQRIMDVGGFIRQFIVSTQQIVSMQENTLKWFSYRTVSASSKMKFSDCRVGYPTSNYLSNYQSLINYYIYGAHENLSKIVRTYSREVFPSRTHLNSSWISSSLQSCSSQFSFKIRPHNQVPQTINAFIYSAILIDLPLMGKLNNGTLEFSH